MRKPKPIKISANAADSIFHLRPGERGQQIIYLTKNSEPDTVYWIERKTIPRLKKWLDKAIAYGKEK